MSARASFVIPAYNADRWISKAIWSCRNQTIKQIEVIVVNDGSTDATRNIIEWHANEDPRVKMIHMEQNAGRSAARNAGNAAAQSDLLMVLDADDMATRNRAKDTITSFQLKKPDVLYGSFFVVDSMGVTGSKIVCGPFDPVVNKEKKMNFICHSTMAYSKKVTESVQYQDGVYTELGLDDWQFQWEAYRKGFKIMHLRNPLCYYRVTESGTMANRDQAAVAAAKEDYLAKL